MVELSRDGAISDLLEPLRQLNSDRYLELGERTLCSVLKKRLQLCADLPRLKPVLFVSYHDMG